MCMHLNTGWWTVQSNSSLQHFYGHSYIQMNWHYWERAQTYQKDANKHLYLINSNWISAHFFHGLGEKAKGKNPPHAMIGKKPHTRLQWEIFSLHSLARFPRFEQYYFSTFSFYKLQVFMGIWCTHSETREMLSWRYTDRRKYFISS